ncbi:MAG: hypothetical protein GX781_01395 [Clostridiales bacterium]|nr:hypothetical protein [Clostridiales bacterium]
MPGWSVRDKVTNKGVLKANITFLTIQDRSFINLINSISQRIVSGILKAMLFIKAIKDLLQY